MHRRPTSLEGFSEQLFSLIFYLKSLRAVPLPFP